MLSWYGLNTRAIEALLIKKYQSELIFKLTINVFVVNYSERVVFLTGSVNRQGPYTFPPEVEAMNIVVLYLGEEVFPSGDLPKKIKFMLPGLFHDENGNAVKTETYTVDVEALSKGLVKFGSSKKFWIYPGDRIEVHRLI